nr:MAG TPA: hypothetical protein [Caudoviricetes sp.]
MFIFYLLMFIYHLRACEEKAAYHIGAHLFQFLGEVLGGVACCYDVVKYNYAFANEEGWVGAYSIVNTFVYHVVIIVMLCFALTKDINMLGAINDACAFAHLLCEAFEAAHILAVVRSRYAAQNNILAAYTIPAGKRVAHERYSIVNSFAFTAFEGVYEVAHTLFIYLVRSVSLWYVVIKSDSFHNLHFLEVLKYSQR